MFYIQNIHIHRTVFLFSSMFNTKLTHKHKLSFVVVDPSEMRLKYV